MAKSKELLRKLKKVTSEEKQLDLNIKAFRDKITQNDERYSNRLLSDPPRWGKLTDEQFKEKFLNDIQEADMKHKRKKLIYKDHDGFIRIDYV